MAWFPEEGEQTGSIQTGMEVAAVWKGIREGTEFQNPQEGEMLTGLMEVVAEKKAPERERSST